MSNKIIQIAVVPATEEAHERLVVLTKSGRLFWTAALKNTAENFGQVWVEMPLPNSGNTRQSNPTRTPISTL